MGLARRLALLTAVIAVALVLGATEVSLRWSERSRLDDRRRESVELATSWSEYLSRVAPHGERDAITQALTGWPSQHLSLSNAAMFVRREGSLELVASSDTVALSTPSRNDTLAMATRRSQVRYVTGDQPAWNVAMPVGPDGRPYGVLHVSVSTATLRGWARLERQRAYVLALLAALLVAGAVAYLTSTWVGGPLSTLGAAMAGAHAGVANAPAAPELGPEEFRLLAREYNGLREALTARQRESEARAALLALEERARGLDRLALLEETATGFAHEIGTPLNTVSGHLQLLRDDLQRAAQPAAVDRVQLLLAQVDRLAGIVQARLDRGGWPAPTLQATELDELARRMLRFLEPSLVAARVSARLEPSASGPVIAWCDPALVDQILLNLLKNAIEALDTGGSVALRVGASADRAWIDVADSGPGIAPIMQQQLFNPFVSTKGEAGTGLGLAVSRRLARAQGGELEHIPGAVGTTWRLSLSRKPV
jgi:two-component system, NtrC family, sensor kinase